MQLDTHFSQNGPAPLGGIVHDAAAGANLALAMLPKAMAYAAVAGVPPAYGLYASCAAPVLAVAFGSNRLLFGDEAQRLIPKIRFVIETYKFRAYGDYHPWPGPNSNSFVQAALDAVPELNAVLPPTAIGKDYPYNGEWYGLTPSRTGIFLNFAGYLGLKIGWVEGIELNLLGGVIGIDVRRPAIKLPGVVRLGTQLSP